MIDLMAPPPSRPPPAARQVEGHVIWKPWPKQEQWLRASRYITFVLAGGARGPGKTEAGIVYLVDHSRLQYPRYAGQVIRKDYQDLIDWNDRAAPLYQALGGEWLDYKKYWQFPGGAKIHLGHLHTKGAVESFKGKERQAILFEELTQLPVMADFLAVAGSCRSTIPGLVPTMFCTTNPDGAGHQWVKKFWGLGKAGTCKPAHVYPAAHGLEHATKIYIPGVVQDNPTLMEHDPGYLDKLRMLDERMYRAWALGDWDAFDGLIFQLHDAHICTPFEIPPHWPILNTFDWGYARPFSFGWWTIDPDGRLYRIGEWYGCRRNDLSGEVHHDEGLKLSDDAMAEGLARAEKALPLKGGLRRRGIVRLADPTIFNKRTNHADGSPIPSTAEVFARHGFQFQPGDPDRRQKYRQLHARLRVPETGEAPMLQVFPSCTEFLRTIPSLGPDRHNPEDVDQRLEDHIYDETGHAVMAYPMSAEGAEAAVADALRSRARRAAVRQRG